MISRTLSVYFGVKFAKSVAAIFAAFLALIFLVDFVELLRRSSEYDQASGIALAGLSLMRAPAIAEQVLPFAVLFAAIGTLLGLSRKLELVVARAAGISAWQFLAALAIVAFAYGLFAVGVFNPASAYLKRQAEGIEARLLKRPAANKGAGLWIRQKSVDGQSVLRALSSSQRGVALEQVTAFVFDAQGRFQERVDAQSAQLGDGFWTLAHARINAPGETPQDAATYYLATNLTPDRVTQSFESPDSVPFWQLIDVRDATHLAGLNATGYDLRLQTLLARPLLLVAMVIVASCFSLRLFRMGGVARSVLGGVVTGIVLYVFTKLTGDLAGAGMLDTRVAAWVPPILGIAVGCYVLLSKEDG